jgi:hypothetical protein
MDIVHVIVDNPRTPMNFLKARPFGEINILFDHNVSPTYLQRIYPVLLEKLEDIKPTDYVIPTGPPSLIALVGHIFLSKVGRLRLLQWDRETQQYYLVEVYGGNEVLSTNDSLKPEDRSIL